MHPCRKVWKLSVYSKLCSSKKHSVKHFPTTIAKSRLCGWLHFAWLKPFIHVYVSTFTAVLLFCTVPLPAYIHVDGPNFEQGDNDTRWVEYMQGMDVDLSCSVIGSNPSNFTLTTTNTSDDSTNIVLWQNSTTVVYSLTNATSANNGFFNCSADNEIAITNFSYWAFFGGKKNL